MKILMILAMALMIVACEHKAAYADCGWSEIHQWNRVDQLKAAERMPHATREQKNALLKALGRDYDIQPCPDDSNATKWAIYAHNVVEDAWSSILTERATYTDWPVPCMRTVAFHESYEILASYRKLGGGYSNGTMLGNRMPDQFLIADPHYAHVRGLIDARARELGLPALPRSPSLIGEKARLMYGPLKKAEGIYRAHLPDNMVLQCPHFPDLYY